LTQHEHNRSCAFTTSGNSFKQSILLNNEREIEEHLKKASIHTRTNAYIPLVFHIVLEEGRDSIGLSNIEDQIELLNEAFNGQNKDLTKVPDEFRNTINRESDFLFCLASKMEGEKEVRGLVTKYTDIENFGDNLNIEGKRKVKFTQFGGSDAWDTDHFLNIWITDLELWQGITTFPNSINNNELGIIIDPDYFGSKDEEAENYPYHKGKTLIHEMGHYFNLYHTWGLEESCNSDDGVEDTPLQEVIYRSCPSGQRISCGSSDMYMNFMNFTDDNCLIFFTRGQMDRMHAALELYYPSLLSDASCFNDSEIINPLEDINFNYNPGNKNLVFDQKQAICKRINIELFSIDGKLLVRDQIFCERKEEINLNNFSAGIYILFLQAENNFISHKLFVY